MLWSIEERLLRDPWATTGTEMVRNKKTKRRLWSRVAFMSEKMKVGTKRPNSSNRKARYRLRNRLFQWAAIAIYRLIDDAKCYEIVRNLRWPNGIGSPCHYCGIGYAPTRVFRKRICRCISPSFSGHTISEDEEKHSSNRSLLPLLIH